MHTSARSKTVARRWEDCEGVWSALRSLSMRRLSIARCTVEAALADEASVPTPIRNPQRIVGRSRARNGGVRTKAKPERSQLIIGELGPREDPDAFESGPERLTKLRHGGMQRDERLGQARLGATDDGGWSYRMGACGLVCARPRNRGAKSGRIRGQLPIHLERKNHRCRPLAMRGQCK
ncbi:hypothetical protein BV20DRAFT_964787 [Pilatotrama ljubarskyi]|nr:hypothetical protein BV20DRAFT_964787 [Pilatotrama ljubarskyi]